VLIDGLSAERVLYPGRVAPERQVCMLDHLLDSFRAARLAPPGRVRPVPPGCGDQARERAAARRMTIIAAPTTR
jgi:hypothetical protein